MDASGDDAFLSVCQKQVCARYQQRASQCYGKSESFGHSACPSKSTISYQNKHRDWRLFRDYYYQLLKRLGQQAGFKQVIFRIKSKIYLLDSTTISLCLSLFDWAKYKTRKGAVKSIPCWITMAIYPLMCILAMAKPPIIKGAYDIPLLAGSVIVADRFYNDFSLLNVWDSSGVWFVIRHKENLQYRSLKEFELPDGPRKLLGE